MPQGPIEDGGGGEDQARTRQCEVVKRQCLINLKLLLLTPHSEDQITKIVSTTHEFGERRGRKERYCQQQAPLEKRPLESLGGRTC
jgi:hypothetical protein